MQFLVNIWNAQRNAKLADQWEKNANLTNAINEKLADQNAALRSQINQRGAGGKFVPKQPK